MGTNGQQRPMSAQTWTVPPNSSNNYPPPWLQSSSISPEPEAFDEVGWEGTEDADDRSLDILQVGQDDKKRTRSEIHSVGTSMSSARSSHGSSDHDTTPRIKSVENHLPDQVRADDLSPMRQVSQDSAYESIMGEEQPESRMVDVDLQVSNIRARERVEIMRGRVLQTRHVISEKRQELQFLRERLRDTTDDLMRAVNKLIALENVTDLQSLVPHHEALRKSQDELGPAENAYDVLEIRLNREEEELEQEESYFYTHNNIRLTGPCGSRIDNTLTPRAVPYEPEEPDFPSLNLESELVQQYLEKVSEAGFLKEQLHDLENEQYNSNEELAFRERHTLTLSKEKAAFLDDFPRLRRDLVDTLEKLEDDLYTTRDRCIRENLFEPSDYPYEPYDALIEEIYESIDDVRDQRPLYAHHTQHLANFETKQDYVNTWLLEYMQESTLETMQLKSFIYLEYPTDRKDLLGDDWTDLALEFWDQDSAGKGANGEQRLSTINAVLRGTGSSLELEDWGFGLEPIRARSLSPQKGGQDVGIELPYVNPVHSGQGPIQRRRRASDSRARSF